MKDLISPKLQEKRTAHYFITPTQRGKRKPTYTRINQDFSISITNLTAAQIKEKHGIPHRSLEAALKAVEKLNNA